MFFRAWRQSKKAFGFLINYVEFSRDTIAIFGFEKGSKNLAASEWMAGPYFEDDRGCIILSSRIAVPFQSFHVRLSNQGVNGMPSEDAMNFLFGGKKNFRGLACHIE